MILMTILNSALLIGLAYMSYQLLQKLKSQQHQLQRAEALIAEGRALGENCIKADLQFSRQLQSLDKQLLSLSVQIQQLENKRDNDGGYHHALRILEMGGTREEIMESCHLSNAQADLFMNLHAYRAAIEPKNKKPHVNKQRVNLD